MNLLGTKLASFFLKALGCQPWISSGRRWDKPMLGFIGAKGKGQSETIRGCTIMGNQPECVGRKLSLLTALRVWVLHCEGNNRPPGPEPRHDALDCRSSTQQFISSFQSSRPSSRKGTCNDLCRMSPDSLALKMTACF